MGSNGIWYLLMLRFELVKKCPMPTNFLPPYASFLSSVATWSLLGNAVSHQAGIGSISIVWVGHGEGLTCRPISGTLDYHNQLPRGLYEWWYSSPPERNGNGAICFLGQDFGVNIPDKQRRPRLPPSPGTQSYLGGQGFPGRGHNLRYLQALSRGVLLGVTLQGNWKHGKHGLPEDIIVTTWRSLNCSRKERSQWKPRWKTNMAQAPWWSYWKPSTYSWLPVLLLEVPVM